MEDQANLGPTNSHCNEIGEIRDYIEDGHKKVLSEVHVGARRWTTRVSLDLAIYTAEQVIGIFEAHKPLDHRPRQAIMIAKQNARRGGDAPTEGATVAIIAAINAAAVAAAAAAVAATASAVDADADNSVGAYAAARAAAHAAEAAAHAVDADAAEALGNADAEIDGAAKAVLDHAAYAAAYAAYAAAKVPG